ncbi:MULTISPECIES: AzlC family ABC transporter permease [Paracoccus]|uniref:4-azaleucine resistance transporter AzlC n=1 Tax=Paracoccus versutus TaxID=34007 RepID=A0A3D9XDA0_PARVE|nr:MULTISPECIES: AzlC family ABC transporter permease [Paracoccus]REF68384.1 4-azaleucine resistance transporter AzlC [Paracoccus versutus]WGR59041.1 branched-chain amino acid ABC transporter permease [Paracoccus versutus]SFY45800.1 4-azaleucine resistance probable transporter AzlC [Paracoccus pantotrophus]
MSSISSFLNGVGAALPIAAAYVPVAFTLGAASSQLGFAPVESALWSLVMFSGANQALLLSSLVAGTPLVLVAFLCAIASFRHILYGIVLADRVPEGSAVRFLFGYGLTDEVFATAVGTDRDSSRKLAVNWLIGLALTALVVWVIGTGVGSAVGDALEAASPKVQGALNFALPALFLALVWSMASRSTLVRMMMASAIAIGFVSFGHPQLAIPAGAVAALFPVRSQ